MIAKSIAISMAGINCTIQRYYRFMQLKASNPSNILLISTLNIELVWQTHLLRPNIYQNDCLRLLRRIIDHSFIIDNVNQAFKDHDAFFDTCQLYEQRFGEKYCPQLPRKITLYQIHLVIMKICFHRLKVMLYLMENSLIYVESLSPMQTRNVRFGLVYFINRKKSILNRKH